MKPGHATLAEVFAVLRPDQRIETLPVSDTVFEELDTRFAGFAGHTLVAEFAFEADWSSWERHPAGDELVVLLSGRAEFIIEQPDGEMRIVLERAGSFAVVPAGTWHTARTDRPTRMLFVTPGAGTEHRAR